MFVRLQPDATIKHAMLYIVVILFMAKNDHDTICVVIVVVPIMYRDWVHLIDFSQFL